MDENNTKTEVKLTVSPDISKGIYSNAVKILVNEYEVVFDFAFLTHEGEQTNGALVSRIITNPTTAKGLAEVILKTIEQHKKKTSTQKPQSLTKPK